MSSRTAAILAAIVIAAPVAGAWAQQMDVPPATTISPLAQPEPPPLNIAPGDLRQIPPSPRENANDPIMSDVPTPRAGNPWSAGNLPGGALSTTGTGTGPSPTTGGWGSEGR